MVICEVVGWVKLESAVEVEKVEPQGIQRGGKIRVERGDVCRPHR